jgi:hypothetical protein
VLDDVRMLGRYARGLRTYLRRPLSTADCHTIIREGLADREANFLRLAERGVYANPRSPHRRLLEHAGIELGDLRALVLERGLDGVLDVLFDAGVYVTHEELRGRKPVRRGSLEFAFLLEEAWNPANRPVARQRSGGSRGPGREHLLNFTSWAHDSAYYGSFLSAFGLLDRPAAVWYPPPPITSGLSIAVTHAKVGRPAERWFTQSRLRSQDERMAAAAITTVTCAVSRSAGTSVPFPRHVPPERAREIAAWAASKREAGAPALICATPSSAVRVCGAATEAGMNIAGTFFRMGGEPFTQGKERVLTEAGASGACHYYIGEAGGLAGVACAAPVASGDVHVCAHRLTVSTRDETLPDGTTVPALCFTTIHPAARVVAINLVSDDFATLEQRNCGCELGELGLSLHLHTIRSHEKLTGEGVTFLGDTIVELVETVLPARFGGTVTDYQFVEQEVDGLTRLTLRASPRLGALSEQELRDAVLDHLASGDGGARVMAELWRGAGTLTVSREAPATTRMSKVPPLHVIAEPPDQPVASAQ